MEQLTQRNRTNTTHSPGEESSWRTKLRVPYRKITSRMTSGVLRKGLFAWRESVYGLSRSHVCLDTQASTPLYPSSLSTTPLSPHNPCLSPSLCAHVVDVLVATCRDRRHSLLPSQNTQQSKDKVSRRASQLVQQRPTV